MTVLYPHGYGTAMMPLEQLDAFHGPKMHPEYRRRLFAWLESQHGLIGIGGGWRVVQPARPGFAPEGQSFHQYQTFASGITAYAAVDLVVTVPGSVHRAPTWGESVSAPNYGLHTFITGEPWHMQCVEMRGYQTWVIGGRRDPLHFALPGDTPTPDPDEDDMALITYIAKPPVDLAGNPPWLFVYNGDVRYATNRDTAIPGIEFVQCNGEQYNYLRKCAGV